MCAAMSIVQVYVYTITEDVNNFVGQQKHQVLVTVQWVSFCHKTQKPAMPVSVCQSFACTD